MLPDPGSIPPAPVIRKKHFRCSNLIDNNTPALHNITLRMNDI